MADLSKKISSGLIWRFCERVLAQGVTFVVSLVVSRILGPSAYGIVSLLLVFINLSEVFLTAGFGNALIQKKDSDDLDFSSVFYFNIFFSVSLYVIIFVLSPYVERFYGEDYAGLTEALRVLALRIPITAVNNVQQSYVSRRMAFKNFFFATIGGSLCSAVVGVIMAVKGYGMWALIAQYLLNALVNTLVLWFAVKWRPTLAFSFARLKGLISYGWKILCANLIFSASNNIRSVLIGKIYNSDDLAYYNRGHQISGLATDTLNTTILSVMFPALCKIQDDRVQMKAVVRRSVKTLSYFIFPVMFALATLSEKLTLVVLTEDWLGAVPFIQLFCINGMFQPVIKPCQQVIKAMGRSDRFFILELIKVSITILVLLITMKAGVIYIAIGYVISSMIGMILDVTVGGKMIHYTIGEQIADILKPLIVSTMMCGVMYVLGWLALPNVALVAVQVVAGILFYWIASVAMKDETYLYVIDKVMGKNYNKGGSNGKS